MQNNEPNMCHIVSDEEIFNKPIDYMKLELSDFQGYNATKDFINIPEGKYLTETIIETNIHPHEPNTTVINSSVGDGKTFLAIEMTKRYLTSDKGSYCVIFVAPHKSLVKQYKKDFYTIFNPIFRGFKIPDYDHLTEEDYDEIYPENNTKEAKNPNNINFNCRFPLHVITINCLLGNAGDAVEQSSLKRKYIENIISFAERVKGKGKIVLIMDELHDSIDNFKPELIPNLWRFKTSGVLHKIFTLSATYNEASKVVIKYLADLTDGNLHIIESNRKQLPNNDISSLHIHITEQYNYSFQEQEFTKLFEKIIDNHDHIDILSCSVRIATENITINDSPIRKFLNEKSKDINLCLAQNQYNQLTKESYRPISFKSEYLNTHNNVGTIFKTGISIKDKSNNAFIVILPSGWSMHKGIVNGSKGIFSDGSIDLVQALARVRKKSDIYLIMPRPNSLIIPYNFKLPNYLSILPELDVLKEPKAKTNAKIKIKEDLGDSYVDIYDEFDSNTQRSLLKVTYDRIHNRIDNEIAMAAQASDNQYPELDEFILREGQKVMSNYYAIFGKDLSAYAIWAAFNNQFVNCSIKTVSFPNSSEDALSEEDTIQDIFLYLFMNYYSDKQEQIEVYDYQLYHEFYEKILLPHKNILKSKILIRDSNNKLHRLIMSFIQKSLKGNTRLNEKYHVEIDNHIQDISFEAGDYLLCCIANALLYDGEELLDGATVDLVDAYKNLDEIRKVFVSHLKMERLDNGNRRYYIYDEYNKYDNPIDNFPFTVEQMMKIIGTVQNIHENDRNLKYFEVLQEVDYNNTLEAFKSIYYFLSRTFFQIVSKRQKELSRISQSKGYTPTARPNIYYVEEIHLPTERTGINLLYKYDYMKKQNYEDKILEEMAMEEANQPKWEDIDKMPMSTIIQDENGNLVVLEEKKEKDS